MISCTSKSRKGLGESPQLRQHHILPPKINLVDQLGRLYNTPFPPCQVIFALVIGHPSEQGLLDLLSIAAGCDDPTKAALDD